MDDVIIRLETEQDYRAVEELTRDAFWNVYKPGADEHYYVHTMRNHPDFIPELSLVMEKDGQIIGHVMFSKAELNIEADGKPTGKNSQSDTSLQKKIPGTLLNTNRNYYGKYFNKRHNP